MSNHMDELRALARRAEAGDPTALAEARRFFDEAPDDVWRAAGDLARVAELAVLDLAAGHNDVLKEAMDRKLQALKQELAGPTPTPLEKLLADRTAACWLQVAEADLAVTTVRGLTVAQGRFLDERCCRAHQRLLTAVKMLATVRKLLRPAVAPLDVAVAFEDRRPARPAAARGGARRRLLASASGN